MGGIWLTDELLASDEGLRFMDLFIYCLEVLLCETPTPRMETAMKL